MQLNTSIMAVRARTHFEQNTEAKQQIIKTNNNGLRLSGTAIDIPSGLFERFLYSIHLWPPRTNAYIEFILLCVYVQIFKLDDKCLLNTAYN